MALSSSNTNNYEHVAGSPNTPISSITIDDIDTTAPISVGSSYTVRSVFGGLNKIIKAIKAKFNETDEIETRRRGVSGGRSIAAKTYTFSFPSRTEVANISMDDLNETVTIDGYYTHGYIKFENKPYYVSSLLYNNVELRSRDITYGEVGGNVLNNPGTYKLVAQISHPNDNTTVLTFITRVTPRWYANGNRYPLDGETWTRSSESVEYELF